MDMRPGAVGGSSRLLPPSPGTRLFDHLIRLEEERRRNREAKGLGSLEVDDQLELGELLHRQVLWLGALANAPRPER
jgi:hypothetical protein